MVAPAALGLASAAVSTGGALARLLRGRNRRSAEKLREAGIAQAQNLGQSVAASQPGVSPALAARQGVLAASQAAPGILGQAARLESQETAANTARKDKLVGAITGGLGSALSAGGGFLSATSPEQGGQQGAQGPIGDPQSAGVATGLGTVGASPGGAGGNPAATIATGGLPQQPETGAGLTAPQPGPVPQQQALAQQAPQPQPTAAQSPGAALGVRNFNLPGQAADVMQQARQGVPQPSQQAQLQPQTGGFTSEQLDELLNMLSQGGR